jgi:hypothetical protein
MLDACDWNNPGADAFRGRGDVAAAIAAYGYPGDLVRRIRRIEPDDVVTITREGVVAEKGRAWGMRDMHFGRNRMCRGEVRRDAWPADREERGLVYCAGLQCVVVPIVCGNVSRIEWAPPARREPFAQRPEKPTLQAVPEPSTWALVALGISLVLWFHRRGSRS